MSYNKANIRKNTKNKEENTTYTIILLALFTLAVYVIILSFINNATQYKENIQVVNQPNITSYAFKITNLYPVNIYGEIGNGVFANISQYDQYMILIQKAGSINMTFDFPQNANAQVSLNIDYLGNDTSTSIVFNKLNGIKQISGEAVPSIITMTIKNYGNVPLNGEVYATIRYR